MMDDTDNTTHLFEDNTCTSVLWSTFPVSKSLRKMLSLDISENEEQKHIPDSFFGDFEIEEGVTWCTTKTIGNTQDNFIIHKQLQNNWLSKDTEFNNMVRESIDRINSAFNNEETNILHADESIEEMFSGLDKNSLNSFFDDSYIDKAWYSELHKRLSEGYEKIKYKRFRTTKVRDHHGLDVIFREHEAPKVYEVVLEEEGEYSTEIEYTIYIEDTKIQYLPLLPDDVIQIVGPLHDHIYVKGYSEDKKQVYITIQDDSDLIIVLFPDILLSCTHIATSYVCMRKSIISLKYSSLEVQSYLPSISKSKSEFVKGILCEQERSFVFGSMLHELFQLCLGSNNCSISFIDQYIPVIVKNHYDMLLIYDIKEQKAHEILMNSLPNIQKWFESCFKDYCVGTPKIVVEDILDIEDNIVSPMYGIRGQIDSTLLISIDRGVGKREKHISPLEIKTGKSESICHRIQAYLYTLLLSDHYRQGNVSDALLLYISKPYSMQHLQPKLADIKSIIMSRNAIAAYIVSSYNSAYSQTHTLPIDLCSTQPSDIESLPPMIYNHKICSNCEHVERCLSLRALGGDTDVSGLHPDLKRMFYMLNKNIGWQQKSFFHKYSVSVDIEERHLIEEQSSIWNEDSSERESRGTCIDNLVIVGYIHTEEGLFSRSVYPEYLNNFIEVRLQRLNEDSDSLMYSRLNANDQILVSCSTTKQVNIARGWIKALDGIYVDVLVNRDISVQNRRYNRHMLPLDNNQMLYRIDRCGSFGSCGFRRSSLLDLFLYRDPQHPFFENNRILEEILVLDKGPYICHSPLQIKWDENSKDKPSLQCIFGNNVSGLFEQNLNNDQKKAVLQCVFGRDILNILMGMPGCGKTHTIAFIIYFLYKLGKSVLVVSYTNSAVDNVLLKLIECFVDRGCSDISQNIIRIGSDLKINKRVNRYTYKYLKEDSKSLKDLEVLLSRKTVIFSTAMGVLYDFFKIKGPFDVCIVDEASQLLILDALCCLRRSKRWILAGDHLQLPPLMRFSDGNDQGDNDVPQSIFEVMRECGKISILSRQYRFDKPIMDLINSISYDNSLIFAKPNEYFFSHRIHSLMRKCEAGEWLRSIFSVENHIIWIDHSVEEDKFGKNTVNRYESLVIRSILYELTKCCIRRLPDVSSILENITILSPYRSQLNLVQRECQEFSGVSYSTIDKCQGRENEVVVVSFVRCNAKKEIGKVISLWNRINVSITRPRSKLILIGSIDTLNTSTFIRRLVEYIRSKHLIVTPDVICNMEVS